MNNFYFNDAEIKDLHDFVQLNFLSCYIENGTVIHRFPEKLYHWWRNHLRRRNVRFIVIFA